MITISNLYLQFQKELIFKDFSLKVSKGERLSIVGDSGKGKSTLLHLLLGFVPDFKGDVNISTLQLNAKNIKNIRKQIAWLPQEIALNFQTVEQLFMAPFDLEINKKHLPIQKEIATIFRAFDLSEDLLKKKTKEISGGQKQRILLASIFLTKKPIILLDEPTSALDTAVKKKITDYVMAQNRTIITATHDDYWIEKSDRIIHLD
jgi:putative ABC transport system ATP-binding protein